MRFMYNKPVHNIHLPTLQELQHSYPMESGRKWDFHSFCQSLGSLLLHNRRTRAREADHVEREEGMPSWSTTDRQLKKIIHLCMELPHIGLHLFADSLAASSVLYKCTMNNKLKQVCLFMLVQKIENNETDFPKYNIYPLCSIHN